MSVQVFSGIDALVLYEECSVASDGTLVTDATTVTQTGRQLKVGESGGGGGGGGSSMSFSSGVGTIVGGSSHVNINGIDVVSSHNSISLKGRDSTKLIVNGKATTFGAVMRSSSGGDGRSTPAPEKKVFKLSPVSRISTLDLFCGATGFVKIDPRFVSDSFTVAVQGSGKVELPGKLFTTLSIRVTGNGAVNGADPDYTSSTTKAKSLGIAVTGNGSCSDITALGAGSIAVTGNGNVDISAVDKRQITKQVTGNGRASVRQASANESSAMAAIDAAIEAVSSSAANRAGWVPLSRAAPVKQASPTPIDTVREEVFAKVLAMAETKVKEEKARKADSDSTVKRRRVEEEPDD